jgi:putative PEP-CTERM system TPR-repeat lipoprotein
MCRHLKSRTRLLGLCLVLMLSSFGCTKNPDVAKQEYMKSGDRYVEEKKYAEAIVQYRNALQQDPRFGEVRYKLAEAYLKAGDGRSASREYIRAADLLPDNVDAQVKAATMLLLSRQFEDAKTRAEKALAKDPKNVQAQIIRGNALGGLNELDAAIKQLEEANTLQPTAGAYAAIGVIKGATGAQTDAEKAFRQAVDVDPKNIGAHIALANYLMSRGRATEAEAPLKGALVIDSANVMANRGLVALYVSTNRVAEAEPYLKTLAANDKSPQARWKIALADYFVQTKRPDDARKILEPLGALKESFAASRTRLAGLQYSQKQIAQAHQTINEVLQREPKNTDALLLNARFFAAEGRLDDSLKSVQTAVAANPQSIQAQYMLGTLQLRRRQPDAATTAFAEVLRLNPSAVAAQLQLSRLNLAAGKTEASLTLAEGAAKAVPGNPVIQLNLARNLLARNEVARAESIVKQLQAKYPNSPATQTLAGTLSVVKKDYSGARTSYGKALTLDPLNLEALTGLNAVDVTQKNFPVARARVEAALAKAPTNPDLLILAGRTYASVGDFAASEAAFKKAIEVSPQSLKAYALLGQLYMSQHKLDQAKAEYDAIVKQKPNSVAALTMSALILEVQGNRGEARRRYEQILQIDPGAAVAANNLAYMYAETDGNLDVALQLAQVAKQKLPNSPEIDDTLGYVYLKKDLASMAEPPLESSVLKDPNNAMFKYHLGLAYAKSGKTAKARTALEQALALNPSFEGADDARAVLARLNRLPS